MANELTTLQEKGLTEDEAKLVQRWIDSGRPGIGKLRADMLSAIYNLGYTCQQIHQKFPEYSIESLLYARIHFEWDRRRSEYNAHLREVVPQNVQEAQLEGIDLLALTMKATHMKWRNEIINYMANPDKVKAPDFLPQTMHQYMNVQTQLSELTQPKDAKGAATGPSVFISAPGATVSNADPKDVAKAMIEAMKNKK